MATREVGPGQTYSTITLALAAANPSDVINIHAGTYTENVTVEDTGLTIQNNTGESPVLVGRIFVNGKANTTITGIELTGWATSIGNYAIAAVDGETGLTVSNCVIHDGYGMGIATRNNTKMLLSGNTIYNLLEGSSISGRGISILSGHSTDGTYANGIRILNNYIHDNEEDGISMVGEYITIDGNLIYNHCAGQAFGNHPDGLQIVNVTIDGFSSAKHVIIRNNKFKNSTQLIFGQGVDASNRMEDIWVYNNVAYMDPGTVQGVDLDTTTVKLLAFYTYNGVYVFNNTFGRCNGPCALFSPDTFSNVAGSLYVKNNIFTNNLGTGLVVSTGTDASAGSVDYNIYDATVYQVSWDGGGNQYSFAAFRAAVPTQEVHGLSGTASVESFPTPKLQSGSSAIGSGVDLSASIGSTDIIGSTRTAPWDMGSYKYSPIAGSVINANTINVTTLRVG